MKAARIGIGHPTSQSRSLKGRLVTRSEIFNYPTRNQLDLDTTRQNLEFSKSSFFYSGAKTWNEIPLEIRMRSPS